MTILFYETKYLQSTLNKCNVALHHSTKLIFQNQFVFEFVDKQNSQTKKYSARYGDVALLYSIKLIFQNQFTLMFVDKNKHLFKATNQS